MESYELNEKLLNNLYDRAINEINKRNETLEAKKNILTQLLKCFLLKFFLDNLIFIIMFILTY